MSMIMAFISVFILFMSQTATANFWLSANSMGLISSSCSFSPGRYQELKQLKKEIAAADTVSQARTIALAPTDGAIGALKNARNMMPHSAMT